MADEVLIESGKMDQIEYVCFTIFFWNILRFYDDTL